MHIYNNLVKEFLCGYIIFTRKSLGLTKEQMSEYLRVAPRSYMDLEKGKFCLSAPSLMFFMLHLQDEEAVIMLHRFRETVDREDQNAAI